MQRQTPSRKDSKNGTSNTPLDHHREKLVIFVYRVALRVLLAYQ